MDESSRIALTREELVTLAGLVRLLMMADRSVTSVEAHVAADFADRLAELPEPSAEADPYRSEPRRGAALSHWDWESRWYDAVRFLPSAEQVREAATRVERLDAREAIYVLLHELATHGSMTGDEVELLAWLDETWGLVHRDVEPDPS